MSQLEKAVKCRSGFQELCSKSKTTTIKKKKIQSPETVKRVMETSGKTIAPLFVRHFEMIQKIITQTRCF